MTQRAYTVAELDALREAVEARWWACRPRTIGGWGRSREGSQKREEIEALVRTHMLADHTAQDLYESEKEKT